MHELSLVSSLIRTLVSVKEREGARAIVRFKVRVGEFSGVDLEAFRFAYQALKGEFEELRGAEMEVEVVEGVFKCSECGIEFKGGFLAGCPSCGSYRKVVVSGQELLLTDVELEV